MSPPSLRRPRTEQVRVEDLVLFEVPAGRYHIPVFQRAFRWKREDVLDLFDSLWRGYPIGVFLCWQREHGAAIVTMGHFSVECPARTDAWLIVDGQQRIHSLVAVLREPPLTAGDPRYERRGGDFELYFDLTEARFHHRDMAGPPPADWLPLSAVADSGHLADWLAARRLRETAPDQFKLALKLGRMIREHELSMHIVEQADEASVRLLFARLNHAGRRLHEAEIFNGLHRDVPGEVKDLDQLRKELVDEGYGPLPEKALLAVSLAVGGAEYKRKLHSAPQDTLTLTRVKPALTAALDLLRDVGQIVDAAQVPNSLSLCAIAILHERFGAIDPRNSELLCRFVWRGTIRAALNGRDQELAARVYTIVRAKDRSLSGIVQGLLALIPRDRPAPLDLDRFSPTSGLSRLLTLALYAREPRDLSTGRRIDLDQLRDDGPMRLTRILPPKAIQGLPHSGGLANVLLHPPIRGHSTLASALRSSPPLLRRERLESHLLDEACLHLLQAEDYAGFLVARTVLLRAHIEPFLAARCRWDPADMDRPPIASLVAEDAHDDDL